MKCPTCGENTPDAWERLIAQLKAPDDAPATEAIVRLTISSASVYELSAPGQPHPHRISFDQMYCANAECRQLVIRGHDTYTVYGSDRSPSETTDTWLVHPRHASRPLDPLVLEDAPGLASDYAEAAALLDVSYRMSAVISRRILADLLERYAGMTDYGLAERVDKFIADEHRPSDLRQHLHYLREIADFVAHTQTNDQFERIEIDQEEAEWTLTIIERLFDYFIVSPAAAKRLREGMDAKLEAAGRKPIKPLALEEDG